MSRPISRNVVRVCSVAQNFLAEAYLLQILRADPHICPLNLEQYARLSPTKRAHMIFVIDECGLDAPLCECLKHLRGECLNPKFLVLDRGKSTVEIVRLLVLGAHGYVAHADVSHSIVRAVLSIGAGHLWVTPGVFQDFLVEVGSVLRKDIRPRGTTTPRESEILE